MGLKALNRDETRALAALRRGLQLGNARKFEFLVADALGFLLGVPVFVAKGGGFQGGADGGTAGIGGIALRVECKRYLQSTSSKARTLKGGIREALEFDPILDVWVLASTKAINETDRIKLAQAGHAQGVPVIFVDWTTNTYGKLPPLAALCAQWPDTVERQYGMPIRRHSAILRKYAAPVCKKLREDFRVWTLGYAQLREESMARLKNIWNRKSESLACLSQDAAGGAELKRLPRQSITNDLDAWWKQSDSARPAAVVGKEGYGKTWATLAWLVQRSLSLPVVLILPASMFVDAGAGADGLWSLLTKALAALTHTQDEPFWRRRLSLLLKRPSESGPSLLIYIDGLNQQPHFPWGALLQTFQGDDFRTTVRLIFSARASHFRDDLDSLENSYRPPVAVKVKAYDRSPGGEFETILEMHGLKRNQIKPSMMDLATVPRLFPLVAQLRDNPALESDATVHRLLWEYGRGATGNRMGQEFTEASWTAWVIERGLERRKNILAGEHELSLQTLKSIGEGLVSPGADAGNVKRRLSELIDGHYFREVEGYSPQYQMLASVAALGLALALLQHAEAAESITPDSVEFAVDEWLDPIGALDQAGEILGAALSILSATEGRDGTKIADVLLARLMHGHNTRAALEDCIASVAWALPNSTLDVLEQSSVNSQAAGVKIASQALRRVWPSNVRAWCAIEDRLVRWAARVTCPKPKDLKKERTHYAIAHRDRLLSRIGAMSPGVYRVFGVPLSLAHHYDSDCGALIGAILEGHPLSRFLRVLVAMATAHAVNFDSYSKAWPSVKWLVMLNANDGAVVRESLRALSKQVLSITPEPNVLPELRQLTSAVLLWMTGDELDEAQGEKIDPDLNERRVHEREYLNNPNGGIFSIEFRNAHDFLQSKTGVIRHRLERTVAFWVSPSFQFADKVRLEIIAAAKSPEERGKAYGQQRTVDEERHEAFLGALARCSPRLLRTSEERRFELMLEGASQANKYWVALRSPSFSLLMAKQRSLQLNILRTTVKLTEQAEESLANNFIAMTEVLGQSIEAQLATVADDDSIRPTLDLLSTLSAATSEELFRFLSGRPAGDERALLMVAQYLAYFQIEVDALLKERIYALLESTSEGARASAFAALSSVDAPRFGQHLLDAQWRADTADFVEAHHGSAAVIAASSELLFDCIAPLLAPWRLLDAVSARKDCSVDVRKAVRCISAILSEGEPPTVSVRMSMRQPDPDRTPRYRISSLPSRSIWEMGEADTASEDSDTEVEAQLVASGEAIGQFQMGAGPLYLRAFDNEGIRYAWIHASDEMRSWIDKDREDGGGLTQRIRRAEGLFVGLCEVLLSEEPETGASLWEVLQGCLLVSVIGTGEVSELVHMLFRAPESPAVLRLRESLLSQKAGTTDKALLETVIAAQCAGRQDWLDRAVSRELTSEEPWRRKRAIVLSAFAARPDVNDLKWPSGFTWHSSEQLEQRMMKWANRGPIARHWWNEFWASDSVEGALAAWHLFLASADRRAHSWMQTDADSYPGDSALNMLKAVHWRLNRTSVSRAMDRQENGSYRLDERFVGAEAPSPWLSLDEQCFIQAGLGEVSVAK